MRRAIAAPAWAWRRVLGAVAAAILAGWPQPPAFAATAAFAPSPLALAGVIEAGGPRLILAQRSIDREWSAPGDSGYAAAHPAGARSLVGAMALSAVVPGAGQIYAGRTGGFYFAAAELAGWIGWAVLQRDADRLRDDAGSLAGNPADSSSAWSFDRWEDATQGDASHLRALYGADREAFYNAIDSDVRYTSGWRDASERRRFGDMRDRSDHRAAGARWTGAGLWVNHVIAALQALRAARLYNVDVELAGMELRAHSRWRDGSPGVLLTLERRF